MTAVEAATKLMGHGVRFLQWANVHWISLLVATVVACATHTFVWDVHGDDDIYIENEITGTSCTTRSWGTYVRRHVRTRWGCW